MALCIGNSSFWFAFSKDPDKQLTNVKTCSSNQTVTHSGMAHMGIDLRICYHADILSVEIENLTFDLYMCNAITKFSLYDFVGG